MIICSLNMWFKITRQLKILSNILQQNIGSKQIVSLVPFICEVYLKSVGMSNSCVPFIDVIHPCKNYYNLPLIENMTEITTNKKQLAKHSYTFCLGLIEKYIIR